MGCGLAWSRWQRDGPRHKCEHGVWRSGGAQGLAGAGPWVSSAPEATYLLTGLQELINGHHAILIPVHFL